MNYSLVLLSAGKGLRFGESTPKQYLALAGKPMIVHALERIEDIPEICETVIVCHPDYEGVIKKYLSEYRLCKKTVFTSGGESRQDSVYNGLIAASYDNIILHEAARPLVSTADFRSLIECPKDNVTYTYPIAATVLKKSKNDYISDILNRDELVCLQAPQKFVKSDLLKVHNLARRDGAIFTEDAGMLYYYTKQPVYCLRGKPYNVKITEYTDLLFAETLFQEDILEESL